MDQSPVSGIPKTKVMRLIWISGSYIDWIAQLARAKRYAEIVGLVLGFPLTPKMVKVSS